MLQRDIMILWLGNRRGGVWNRRPEASPFIIHKECFLFLKALYLAPNNLGRTGPSSSAKMFQDRQRQQGRWPEPAGGKRRGRNRRSAGSEASHKGVSARLQESPAPVVDRRGPSDDQVRNTYKDSVWSKKESLGASLRREVPKRIP